MNSLDSKSQTPPSTADSSDEAPRSGRWATIPNFLSLFRWLGSPLLIVMGVVGEPRGFVIAYLVLSLSDWIDGKIAVGWNQRSRLGARLDSWADATLYGCLLIGACLLWWETLVEQWPWIALAVGSYAIATTAGFVKFGRWPSYHTRSAKLSWGFVLIAVACVAWSGPMWPLIIAMLSVTLANLESLWITTQLKHWHNDVIGFWVVKHLEAEAKESPKPTEQ